MQPEPLRLVAEKPRDQRLNDVGFDFLRETLTDNRRRHMPAAEAWQAGHLLIFLNQRFGLTHDFFGRYLDLNLALGRAFFSFGGAHSNLSRYSQLSRESRKVAGALCALC